MTTATMTTRPKAGTPISRITRIVKLNLDQPVDDDHPALGDHPVDLRAELGHLADRLHEHRPGRRRQRQRGHAVERGEHLDLRLHDGHRRPGDEPDVPARARLRRHPPRLLPRQLAHLRAALGDVRGRPDDPGGARGRRRTDGASAAGCSRPSTSAARTSNGGCACRSSSSSCCSSSSSEPPSRRSTCAGRRPGWCSSSSSSASLLVGLIALFTYTGSWGVVGEFFVANKALGVVRMAARADGAGRDRRVLRPAAGHAAFLRTA